MMTDAQTLIDYLATRWDIELLFADTKVLLGLPMKHSPPHTARAVFFESVALLRLAPHAGRRVGGASYG